MKKGRFLLLSLAVSLALYACTNPFMERLFVPDQETNEKPSTVTYTVSFNSNGGSLVQSQKVAEGGRAVKPNPSPTKIEDGIEYYFVDWFSDEGLTELYDFDTHVFADKTLYAQWTETSFTVRFDSRGGIPEPAPQDRGKGGRAEEPPAPEKAGYKFGGWFKEEGLINAWDFNTDTVTEDITLYAKWLEIFTVSFDSGNGGSPVLSQEVAEGEPAEEPADPERLFVTVAGLYEGSPDKFEYEFDGWFDKDNNPYNFDAPVMGDITLTAKWTIPAGSFAPIAEVAENNVTAAVAYANNNAGAAPSYTLLMDQDDTVTTNQSLGAGVNLTILGIESERTIRLGNGVTSNSLFTVNANASLTLGNNITLRGAGSTVSSVALVSVTTGTLTMKTGSKITGHTASYTNGAVHIKTDAKFVMEGGEISENKSTSYEAYAGGGINASNSTIEIRGGTIMNNTSRYDADDTDTNPADIHIDYDNPFYLSGNAVIGVLTLAAYNSSTICNITIDKAYTGSTTLNLHASSGGFANAIGWWGDKVVISAGSDYTLTKSDIDRFTLGKFTCLLHNLNRAIRGHDEESGIGNYAIASTGADIGKLVRVFTRGELLTDTADIVPYLDYITSQYGEGNNADNPAPLRLRLDLEAMTEATSNWQKILTALYTAGKYVDLNLSPCIIEDGASTEFDPDSSVASGKNRIVSIALPNAATSVVNGTWEASAFNNFTALRSFSGTGLTTIGFRAFGELTSLTMTSLPAGIISISTSAFMDCPNLALTSLPAGLQSIGELAFMNCTNLALTSLPAGITGIPESAFSGCTNLALTSLPAGLTSISNQAFSGCTSLALTALPNGLLSIGQYAFSGCTSLALTALPANLTYISSYAFSGCTGLTTISWSLNITSIPEAVFSDCSNLTQITLHEGITFIGRYAFQNTKLAKITLHEGVTTIESSAFLKCTSLAIVTCLATTPPNLEDDYVFKYSPTNDANYSILPDLKIYVPANSVETYKNASGWITYKDRIFPIGGTEFIDITFEEITDIPDIDGGTIYRTGAKKTITFTLANPSLYTNPVWTIERVDLTPFELSTTSSCTVDATNIAYNSLGRHAVHLQVLKGGVPYSKTIWVTIVESEDEEDFGAGASITQTFNVATTAEWNSAVSAIISNGNGATTNIKNYVINVTANFAVTGSNSPNFTITFPRYTRVSLRGAGRTLTLSGEGNLIRIGHPTTNNLSNQTVILRDLNLQGNSENNSSVVFISGVNSTDCSSFIMRSGKITGNTSSSTSGGGGVYVVGSGIFTMYGGEISGNKTTSSSGGGVNVNSGTFRLVTGTIYGSDETNISLRNTSNTSGDALFINGTNAQRGTFSGTTWIPISPNLATTNNTIRVVGGELK